MRDPGLIFMIRISLFYISVWNSFKPQILQNVLAQMFCFNQFSYEEYRETYSEYHYFMT